MREPVHPQKGLPLIREGRIITQQAVNLTHMLGLNSSDFGDITRVVGKILGHDASYYKRMEVETPGHPAIGKVVSEVSDYISIQVGENDEIIIKTINKAVIEYANALEHIVNRKSI